MTEAELPQGRQPIPATASAEELRNLALAVVLQWGPAARVPALERLRAFAAQRPDAELQAALDAASGAQRIGNDYLWDHSEGAGDHVSMAPFADMAAAVIRAHPWVDEENMGHLYSQACYYVWHG
jgi:hypothetical protein